MVGVWTPNSMAACMPAGPTLNDYRRRSGATFVLGYDTATRIVMPKYYGGERAMELRFQAFQLAGSSFVVGGRADASGRFLTLADIAVPPCLERLHLFRGVPETLFRNDVSSTQLREQIAARGQ